MQNDLAPTFDTIGDEVRVPTQKDAMELLIKQDVIIRGLKKKMAKNYMKNGADAQKWKKIASEFAKEHKKVLSRLETTSRLLAQSEKDKRSQSEIISHLQDDLERTTEELTRTKAALIPYVNRQLAALPDEELDLRIRAAMQKIGRGGSYAIC
jgi:arsenate reductase-like glutaredoxin family protein